MHIRETLQSFDWVLFGTAVLLVWLGIAMLLSVGSSEETLLSPRVLRQSSAFGIALVGYLAVSLVPYHALRRYAPALYAIGAIVLAIVGQLGGVIRGTTSRLVLGGVQIQPSEFMKVAVVIMLAWLFARQQQSTLRTHVLGAVLIGIVIALILLEPDLGMAALITGTWILMIVFLGIPWRTVVILGLLLSISFAAAWIWLLADYQKERLRTFIDPGRDPLGTGYNRTQSLIAFGSGELLGRGLGQGTQSQLNFLPEKHTDFMLASIGEELGFVGVVLVTSLYSILLWRILRIARTTNDSYGQLLSVGVFTAILLSFFVSAGMNIGLLPVTGIPLPLVSYGGSNLVSTFLLLGLVQSVHAHSRWKKNPPIEFAQLT